MSYGSDKISFEDIYCRGIRIPVAWEQVDIPGYGNVRCCRFGTVYVSDYLDFPDIEKFSAPDLKQLVKKLKQRNADILWWSNIPVGSRFHHVMTDSLTENTITLPCVPAMGLTCSNNFNTYLLSRSRNFRRNYKRFLRRLHKNGVGFLVKKLSLEDIEWFLHNQALRARVKDYDPFREDDAFVLFIQSMATLENVDSVCFVKEGLPISMLIVLREKKSAAIYAQAFDERWKSYYPSYTLITRYIQYVHETGSFRYLDFLRGEEGYKQHFINNRVEMSKFILFLNDACNSNIVQNYLREYEE